MFKLLAHSTPLFHPSSPHRHSCASPLVIPTPLPVIPAQAGTHTHPTTRSTPTPSPIHPSPLPGGRLGGGWNAASQRANRAVPDRPHRTSVAPAPPSFLRPYRHSCVLPSFLRRQEPAAHDEAPLHLWRLPAALKRHLGGPSGYCGAYRRRRSRGSCLRRNDERGWGVDERGANERRHGSRRPTPHLTSPLRGGRDELGKGWVL